MTTLHPRRDRERPATVVVSVALAFVASTLGTTACKSAATPDPRLKDPCVTCTPEAYCAAWSPAEDRRCSSDQDCLFARIAIADVHCNFGWYGGSLAAIASREGEPRVRARLAKENPCDVATRRRGGSVCASPPLECREGLCGYKNGPPRIAF